MPDLPFAADLPLFAVSPNALSRLARRIGRPSDTAGWAPPPLPDLIARIDDALAERRAR